MVTLDLKNNADSGTVAGEIHPAGNIPDDYFKNAYP